MTSKTPIRSMEDVDEKALDYAIIKGIATGNPLMQEKTELDTKTAKLKMLKQSYLSQKYELEEMVERKYPQQIKECEQRIESLKEDSQHLKANTTSLEFCPMELQDKVYEEKAKAGEKILELCKQVHDTKGMYIGKYRGFEMYLEFETFSKAFQVVLKNKQNYRATLGNDKLGVITRINNALESIEKSIPTAEDNLMNLRHQLKNAQENLEVPFAQEKELQEALKRLKEVNAELKIGEVKTNDNVEIDDENEEKMEDYQETQNRKRKRDYAR